MSDGTPPSNGESNASEQNKNKQNKAAANSLKPLEKFLKDLVADLKAKDANLDEAEIRNSIDKQVKQEKANNLTQAYSDTAAETIALASVKAALFNLKSSENFKASDITDTTAFAAAIHKAAEDNGLLVSAHLQKTLAASSVVTQEKSGKETTFKISEKFDELKNSIAQKFSQSSEENQTPPSAEQINNALKIKLTNLANRLQKGDVSEATVKASGKDKKDKAAKAESGIKNFNKSYANAFVAARTHNALEKLLNDNTTFQDLAAFSTALNKALDPSIDTTEISEAVTPVKKAALLIAENPKKEADKAKKENKSSDNFTKGREDTANKLETALNNALKSNPDEGAKGIGNDVKHLFLDATLNLAKNENEMVIRQSKIENIANETAAYAMRKQDPKKPLLLSSTGFALALAINNIEGLSDKERVNAHNRAKQSLKGQLVGQISSEKISQLEKEYNDALNIKVKEAPRERVGVKNGLWGLGAAVSVVAGATMMKKPTPAIDEKGEPVEQQESWVMRIGRPLAKTVVITAGLILGAGVVYAATKGRSFNLRNDIPEVYNQAKKSFAGMFNKEGGNNKGGLTP
jgi:regulator of replication initiation timing